MGEDDIHPSKIYDLITKKLTEELTDSGDPVGMFAYAVYKRQKIAEIKRLKDALGRRPTNEELQPFVLGAEARIGDFLKIAEIELSEYQEALINEHLEEVSGQFERKYIEETKRFKPQRQASWFKSALYGMAGNIFTIILTFLLFALGVMVLEGAPALAKFLIRMISRAAGLPAS